MCIDLEKIEIYEKASMKERNLAALAFQLRL